MATSLNALIPLSGQPFELGNSLAKGVATGNALLEGPVERRLKEAQAQYYGSPEARASVYGTPIPYQKEDGSVGLGAIRKDGTFQDIETPGAYLPGTRNVDTGTGTTVINSRTGQPVGEPIPKDVSGEASARAQGEAQGKAAVNLPGVNNSAHRLITQVEAVEKDPNLPNMTGYNAYLPNVSPEANSSQSRIDQVQGSAFLQTYDTLRGAGAITDQEGAKAAAAISRLQNLKVGTEEYRQAAKDVKREVFDLVNVARAKAGSPALSNPFAEPGAPPSTQPPSQTIAPGPAPASQNLQTKYPPVPGASTMTTDPRGPYIPQQAAAASPPGQNPNADIAALRNDPRVQKAQQIFELMKQRGVPDAQAEAELEQALRASGFSEDQIRMMSQ